MNSNNKAAGLAGLLAAIAASVCCIIPVLALVAGIGGLASAFSWMEPFRPYFIAATIIILGFAWYQALRSKKEEDCCDVEENKSFLKSKKFLSIITVLAVVLMAFPYYSRIFFPKAENNAAIVVEKKNVEKVQLIIEGMTCTGCEAQVEQEVNKLNGIITVEVSYEKGAATVEFDKRKTNVEQIEKAVNSTGYKVVEKK